MTSYNIVDLYPNVWIRFLTRHSGFEIIVVDDESRIILLILLNPIKKKIQE